MVAVLGVLAWALVIAGCFFALVGAIGVLRMPDFFTRLHPAGKSDTCGATLIMAGLFLRCVQTHLVEDLTLHGPYGWLVYSRLVLIAVVILITSPTATHAITKAAHLDGLKPWRKPGDGEASQ